MPDRIRRWQENDDAYRSKSVAEIRVAALGPEPVNALRGHGLPSARELRTQAANECDSDSRHAMRPAGFPGWPEQEISEASRRTMQGGDWIWFALLSCVKLGAIALFFHYWLRLPEWSTVPAGLAILAVLCAIAAAGNLARWTALAWMKEPFPAPAAPACRVAVVTTCVPELEPAGFLRPTLEALIALDIPHDTWLLDEGDDESIRALCLELGVRHFSRKGQPKYQMPSGPFAAHTKHGNYNAWLEEAGFGAYDVLFAFDPDHIPSKKYTSNLLPYFLDPRVGYVQAPQVYRNHASSWIARGAAEETYAYYYVVQRASFAVGYPVLTGCHSVHRMEALRQCGGFPDHPAEDLLVSLRYRRAGWRGVFVPKVLATGLAPESWPAYLHQQFRWAFSVLDIKWRHLNVRSSLAVVERSIAWIQGFGYLQDAFMGVAALGFLTVRLSTGYGALALDRLHALEPLIAAAVFIAADAFRQKFYLIPEVERGLHWRAALLRAAKWPLALKALVTVARHRRIQYRTTPKIGGGGGIAVALLAPHAVIALLVAGAWIAGMSQSKVEGFWPHFWTATILLLSGGLAVSGLLGRRERNPL